MNKIALLANYIKDSRHAVFLGGAGMSTESGIPDFRSADGLYQGNNTITPETILSHDFFFASIALSEIAPLNRPIIKPPQ